ncbi:methylated-DNA--[protein]-cysteine S-methyltransferase [Streptomyces sp. NPDC059096]|uniref:methylated-DNA--[protein]-cysteine S-methyltransferase n=1 Tax=Streptomyces sp. NPDC059096 TaxID=3346727 RepID=UPI00367B0E93
MTVTLYTTVGSPLGDVLLAGVESATAPGGVALASLSLPDQKGAAVVQGEWVRAPEAFAGVVSQLGAYFDGASTGFDLEYTVGGTEFQRRVWSAVDAVPYGATVTYGQIAERVGASGAGVRAVGTAIGRNPLLVVRPCHRVIGADGALRGYAAGLERKERLLGLEGALTP